MTLAAVPAAPVARISDAERDAIRDYIVRTIDSAVTKVVPDAVTKAMLTIDFSILRGKDGKDGKDGRDGKDGQDAVLDMETLVKEVVTLVSIPKDGTDGENGKDGIDGKDAVLDMDTLALEVAALVPLPKDGKDGKDAEPVDRVTLAKDVLALIPVPRDGKDGIASIDDLRAEVAKAVDASVGPLVQKEVAESIAALPTLQYKGVFREGTTYKAGECVTWAGAMWHANSETQQKPGEGETAWTLMVKRGANGRDAT